MFYLKQAEFIDVSQLFCSRYTLQAKRITLHSFSFFLFLFELKLLTLKISNHQNFRHFILIFFVDDFTTNNY